MIINRSAPRATVVPVPVYEDVGAAIDWLCGTFGVEERLRAAHGGAVSHAQLVVGVTLFHAHAARLVDRIITAGMPRVS